MSSKVGGGCPGMGAVAASARGNSAKAEGQHDPAFDSEQFPLWLIIAVHYGNVEQTGKVRELKTVVDTSHVDCLLWDEVISNGGGDPLQV